MTALDDERLLDGYRRIEVLAEAMADAAEVRDWEAYDAALSNARIAIDRLPPVREEDLAHAGAGWQSARLRLLARILAQEERIGEALDPLDPSIDPWLRREPFSAPPRAKR
ncbi:MAG: hypothetical protein HS109_04150 [Burkholderiales bacterium]|nr:hypothetical protein [Burkholderiales bacterium]